MRRTLTAAAIVAAACSSILSLSPSAEAAGLEYAKRGVRPLGRGGAFVAGADDLGAIYYNPAGIVDAGSSILFDASWVNFSSDYTRKALLRQVDPNTGETVGTYERTFSPVEGSTPFVPVPTIAGSFAFHDFAIAIGAYAPYAALTTYPEEVEGQPAPQRYSLYSLDGSALVVAGIWAGWAPIEQLRVGIGLQFLLGNFRTTQAFSGCLPERFFCSPESPIWDVKGEIAVGPIVAPSGSGGLIWEFLPGWRVGASFQGPFLIDADATIKTRMPSAPVFDEASQEGEAARVQFDLPWALRFGLETRALVPDLRVELAFEFARWSMQDEISVEPDGISLNDVASLPEKYYIPSLSVERGFQDSVSIALGGEYAIEASDDITVDARAGLSYETSGIQEEYLTVLTIDANKFTPSLGAGLHVGEDLRFDFVFAHVFADTVEVDPATARVAQVVPVVANPSEKDIVNGGTYESRATILGLGVVYTFDRPREKAKDEPDEIPKASPSPAEDPAPKPDPEKDPDAEDEPGDDEKAAEDEE